MKGEEQLIPMCAVAKQEATGGQRFVCQVEQTVTNDGKLDWKPPAELWCWVPNGAGLLALVTRIHMYEDIEMRWKFKACRAHRKTLKHNNTTPKKGAIGGVEATHKGSMTV